MIIIFYNNLGLLMSGGPIFIMMLAAIYLPDFSDWWVSFPLCGMILLVWDLAYRATLGNRKLFSPSSGGHIFFIPCWILGLLLIWAYVHIGTEQKRWLPKSEVKNLGASPEAFQKFQFNCPLCKC